ncbi:hypothetical protein PISMIDRAFT_670000 [Pisolithus microcarpus 441]|uniref:Uncharacterized protein n=1 Tax=Pisolithus microcarpus 441 TaxID=765257 RepID=A0A0C9ZYI9_9AGAM|nr:hypothetical protein PISMIDRAFT_670000 [Pisolithus microcarpus 441]
MEFRSFESKVNFDSGTKGKDAYALQKYFIECSSGTVLFVQRFSNDKKNRVHQQFHL